MSFRRFMVCDLIGMLSWIGLIVGLGYAIGHPAVQVAKAISHYALLVTIAVVAIAVAIAVLRAREAAARRPHRRSDKRDHGETSIRSGSSRTAREATVQQPEGSCLVLTSPRPATVCPLVVSAAETLTSPTPKAFAIRSACAGGRSETMRAGARHSR
jgi:hypothetical protein